MAKELSKTELEMRAERQAIKEQMEVAGMEEKELAKKDKAEPMTAEYPKSEYPGEDDDEDYKRMKRKGFE